jgi:hypothetical protein
LFNANDKLDSKLKDFDKLENEIKTEHAILQKYTESKDFEKHFKKSKINEAKNEIEKLSEELQHIKNVLGINSLQDGHIVLQKIEKNKELLRELSRKERLQEKLWKDIDRSISNSKMNLKKINEELGDRLAKVLLFQEEILDKKAIKRGIDRFVSHYKNPFRNSKIKEADGTLRDITPDDLINLMIKNIRSVIT